MDVELSWFKREAFSSIMSPRSVACPCRRRQKKSSQAAERWKRIVRRIRRIERLRRIWAHLGTFLKQYKDVGSRMKKM